MDLYNWSVRLNSFHRNVREYNSKVPVYVCRKVNRTCNTFFGFIHQNTIYSNFKDVILLLYYQVVLRKHYKKVDMGQHQCLMVV